jgi:16S rRNA (adenine1518-N6/adenine1519-N6)-dimethyltransferase
MQNVKPLKKFGQNYLTDSNIIKKIISEISPKPNDNLIEIGPGLGALTGKLIETIPNFTSIEIDKRVISELRLKYPGLNLINDDFLNFNLNEIVKNKNEKLRIVGNIPYNLTSPILFKMFDFNQIIKDSILMVQWEVAKRITALKGTKDYGILAVLMQHFTYTKISFKVSPNVFYPKPKVHSAVIHISFKDDCLKELEKTYFIKIVKASFGNRRKTLKNSLSNSIFKTVNFFNSGIDLTLRAEQLDVKDFVNLAKYTLANDQLGLLNIRNSK